MKRSSRFLIAFAAAAITFGSLTAFMGPRHWGHHRYNHCYADADQHWRHDRHHDRDHNWRRDGHNPDKQPVTPPAPSPEKSTTLTDKCMYGKHNWAGGAKNCGHAFGVFNYPFYGKAHGGYRGGPFRRPKYNVPVNIAETETSYEVYVYALGFAKENIKISVADDLLYVTGTRTVDEANAPNFRRQEYPIKNFEQVISLNGQVNTETISARQEEGVLIITLPKVAGSQKPSQEITII